MAGTTPHGYPYPTGTDRVMDGDNAIQALAQKTDSQVAAMAAGNVTIVTTGTNPSNGSVAVTFPAGRFTTTPRVIMQQLTQIPNATGLYSTCYPSAITPTGFTANCRRSDALSVFAAWVATSVDT